MSVFSVDLWETALGCLAVWICILFSVLFAFRQVHGHGGKGLTWLGKASSTLIVDTYCGWALHTSNRGWYVFYRKICIEMCIKKLSGSSPLILAIPPCRAQSELVLIWLYYSWQTHLLVVNNSTLQSLDLRLVVLLFADPLILQSNPS